MTVADPGASRGEVSAGTYGGGFGAEMALYTLLAGIRRELIIATSLQRSVTLPQETEENTVKGLAKEEVF